MKVRVLICILFLSLCGAIMFTIFSFSAEDGLQSSERSEVVSETIKQEVNTKLNERGLRLVDKLKYYVILHSPYGSNWNANIRKLAHFSIYFALACMVYLSLAILKVKKGWRFILAILVCFLFAMGDEFHQSLTVGRGASMKDVALDTFGGTCAAIMMSIFAVCISGIKKMVENHT